MKLLIKNALIKSMEKPDFVGDVLIENDLIKQVEEAIEPTDDCTVIDAKGLILTPGLIDGHCHIGIMQEGIMMEGDDVNEMTDPVTPQMRAIDGIKPMSDEFREAVEGGVTMAMVGPGSANVVGGQFAIIKTDGKRIDNMIVKAPAAMKIAFGENPKRCYGVNGKAPKTRMGTAAILRETLFKAKNYYEKKRDGKDVEFDMKMEAFLPVFEGKIPLKAHAHQTDDIFTAIRIAKEFNLNLTLDHCTEGHLIIDELSKEKYPVFLGPTFGGKVKFELRNTSFTTAKALYEAGIKFAIVTDAFVIPLKHLSLCAAFACGAGLPEEEAWKTITINPAEILGIADKYGSIAPGKNANITLFKGNPIKEVSAKAVMTFIDGEPIYSDGSVFPAS